MIDLSDLIARLEAATEGSRELDSEIADIVGYRHPNGLMLWPRYTTSLDAKLPSENIVSCMWNSENWSALHDFGDDRPLVEGIGKTEALARRIAALKAREPHP